MKMKIGTAIALSVGFLLSSCAHHRDVRAGAEGIHRVVVETDDNEEGTRNAISQAEHFCKERDKTAAFVTEDKKYTGTMTEENYRTAKTAAKVAQAAGGAAYVFGGKNESNAGGIVGLGGGIANSAIGNGYTVEMKFKCM
ncbi:MAG: hypothetical protein V4736_11950 [Bdellovibrionota bacterium]